MPYLPVNTEFPKNKNGEVLFFLGQVNFAELPVLDNYPESGLLQFYINDDANYGLEEEVPDKQNNFRLLYFPSIERDEELIQHEVVLREFNNVPFPPEKCFALSFELNYEAVPLSDHNIHDFIEDDFFNRFGEGQWEVMSAYSKMVHAGGHKIGGYAFFTQEDPRYEMGEYELLLQLDTEQDLNMQWGDMGVANFFIKKEDLLEKDFSWAR